MKDLNLLRALKGNRVICDDDFYESGEAAEFDIDLMFGFFKGSNTFEQNATIWRLCLESFAFLDNLIAIGEIELGGAA